MSQRTEDRILAHYNIERELADRLRHSTKEDRGHLYVELYDELFQRVPDHPQLQDKTVPEIKHSRMLGQARFLKPMLDLSTVYLELGPGACALAIHVARHVTKVYAVDVSSVVSSNDKYPENLEFVLSDGTSVPVPEGSVDLAFSNQLMEHLHPDDALEQLRNVFRTLTPGGKYFCITPSRLSGPHDVSQHFDEQATCFHLKEYAYSELEILFREVGFTKFYAIVGYRGWGVRTPLFLVKLVESLVAKLPGKTRKFVGRFGPVRLLLGIKLVATK